MSSNLCFRNPLLLAALLLACPALGHAAAAAHAEFVSGKVLVASSSGQRPLQRGSELNAGDTINTGEGRVQLRFADGALMSLQPQTEFRIDDYNYNGKNDGEEKSFFSLLRGGLRTISGRIGKGNHDNYKVNTSVATIGIRGTEWSGVLVPGVSPDDTLLNLGTGEGAIEVCNAAGCIVIASGESAVVTGNTQPRRSDVRPSLPPAATTNSPPPEPVYSKAEDRTASGELVIVKENTPPPQPLPQAAPPQLPPSLPPSVEPAIFSSGPGYSMAVAGRDTHGGYVLEAIDLGKAAFTPNSEVTQIQGQYNKYGIVQGTDYIAAVDTSGTIGWGVWSKGLQTYSGDSVYLSDLEQVHFIVGKGTPAADLTLLRGMTGTYEMIGSTKPSSTLSSDTEVQRARLTAFFAGPATRLDLNMSVRTGTRVYALDVGGMLMNGKSTFSGSTNTTHWADGVAGSGTAWTSVNGFFAGDKASHAGLSYVIADISGTQNITYGTAAFARNQLTPQFMSGSAYALAGSGLYYDGETYSLYADKVAPTNATFSDGKLIAVSGTGYTVSTPASAVTEVGTAANGSEAVLGWGRWTRGSATAGASYSLADAHYVVGTPTPAAQIAEISGTYNYSRIGATTPTSPTLGNATLNAANLAVHFNGPVGYTTELSVNVTAGGRTFNASGTGSPNTTSLFSGQGAGSVGANAAHIQYQGLLAGADAKFAGVTYGLTDLSDNAKVHGAIGFTKGGMVTP